MAALDTIGFGSAIGCGGGRGAVDFAYRVADTTTATDIVRRIIREHLQATEPQIRITE